MYSLKMKFSPLKNKKVSDFSNNKDYIIKTKNNFKIIKYNKKNLDSNNITELGLFRSLIVHDGKIVSFAPQKSVNYENFIDKNNFNDCNITEYIDGTMINIFYNYDKENEGDKENNVIKPGWECCTRSNIGAKCRYNLDNEKTFKDMFLDACHEENIDFDILNKQCCYSFVLQHPENKIVKHIKKPKLFLTRVYTFDNNEILDVTEDEKNINISMPRILNPIFTSWGELSELCCNGTLNFENVGFVIYNKDGVRTKIRNVSYEKVRKLKGNLQKMFLQYITLRKDNKIGYFLTYYPEYKKAFRTYKMRIYTWTNELYNHYVDTFILKKKRLKECPFEFKPILYNIQKEYLQVLKQNNKKITFKYIVDYVHDCIPPKKLMFCINYPLRTTFEKVGQNDTEKVGQNTEKRPLCHT